MGQTIELIKKEIERLKENAAIELSEYDMAHENGVCDTCDKLLDFINSLTEEPKFKVGDTVISTKNPRLTYKVLQVGLPNELGKLDYKVEIFNDGKAGIQVGNTFMEHNIHLISCNKNDEWGKLVEEPVNEDLNKAAEAASINVYPKKYEDDPMGAYYPPTDVNEDERAAFEEGFIAGAQWDRQQIIDKACEYLKGNIYKHLFVYDGEPGFPTAQFIEDFRKAMSDNIKDEQLC